MMKIKYINFSYTDFSINNKSMGCRQSALLDVEYRS